MRESVLTASDVALLSDKNNGFGGENGAWWIIVLIALFGYGRGFGGFGGGYGNGGTSVYEGYVLNNDFSQLSKQISDTYNLTDRKFDAITNGICNLGYTQAQLINGIDKSILTTSNQTNTNISNLGYNLQNCCCDLKAQLADNKYEMAKGFCSTNNTIAMSTRDIVDNMNANYRALHDEIVANRIEDKNAQIAAQQNEINALRLAASQEKQNTYLVEKLQFPKCPSPAYVVPNPYCNCNNGCGCNM